VSKANRKQGGLTLVEVALFLCLVGVLLAMSLPTFFRALRTSKMAEATEELDRIHQRVAAYYATRHELLPPPPPPTKSGTTQRPDPARSLPAAVPITVERCMPEAAGPAPADPSADPVEVDFQAPTTPGFATWKAIGYQPNGPLRYRYSLRPKVAGCGVLPRDSRSESVLVLRAEGDLDSDGTLSVFERSAVMRDDQLTLEPLLVVRDRVE
jgi:type II secretory pathway pseudopilin PulG